MKPATVRLSERIGKAGTRRFYARWWDGKKMSLLGLGAVTPEYAARFKERLETLFKNGGRNPQRLRFPELSRSREGWIYFIQSDAGGNIKIGFSTYGGRRRLDQLQVGSPVKLELLAAIVGTKHDENALHLHFNRLREKGEWFRAGADLYDFIDVICEERKAYPEEKLPPMHALDSGFDPDAEPEPDEPPRNYETTTKLFSTFTI